MAPDLNPAGTKTRFQTVNCTSSQLRPSHGPLGFPIALSRPAAKQIGSVRQHTSR
jgi:hypothetical protein